MLVDILLVLSSLNDLISLSLIHRLLSLLPHSFLSSNSCFMTHGNICTKLMFSAFGASIMYIYSLSQTFHPSCCFPTLMHPVDKACLEGREATSPPHLPVIDRFFKNLLFSFTAISFHQFV